MVAAHAVERGRSPGPGERTERRQDARSLRLRAAVVLVDRREVRRLLRLCDRDWSRRRGPAARELEENVAAGSLMADRRGLELSRRRRSIQGSQSVYRGARGPLRQSDGRRRLRAQGAGARLRGAARDVRRLRAKQIYVDGRDSMDAQQRLAVDALAP